MKYHLAEGCENTFVLYDRLTISSLEEGFSDEVFQVLEREDRDDALILVDGVLQEGVFYARMLVLGRDHSWAEFCGNGARACAAYLSDRYPDALQFYLVAGQGKYLLETHGNGIYSVHLPPVKWDLNEKFIADADHFHRDYALSYVEVLEPHLVIQESMSDDELLLMGRQLNRRRHLFPQGINLNSFHVRDDGTLFVKTYERGVQRLTKSCGTGSIACAAFYQRRGSVQVGTPGGLLEIVLRDEGVQLKGPALIEI